MSVDIHALSGAYAVDALDQHEREAFERHLATCQECQAEVASLQEAAAVLTTDVARTPPEHLRAAVLENIAHIRPLPPVVTINGRQGIPRRAWLTASLLVAAALALLAIWVYPQGSPSDSSLVAAGQIVHAQDAVAVQQHLAQGASLTWYRSAKLDAAAVDVKQLPVIPSGKVYELWLQSSDGQMKPAGFLPSGSSLVTLSGPASTARGAGITVEPTGGSATPTLPAVTLVSFPHT